MIYLNAEVVSGLGEDTFWTWLKRMLGDRAAHGVPDTLRPEDVVLHYSTLGAPKHPKQTIALLWELHPMMSEVFGDQWAGVMAKIKAAAEGSAKRVVASTLMQPFYAQYGDIDVLPIGVDTDLFRPRPEVKLAVRAKYKLPLDGRVVIWAGTTHPMKGYEELKAFRAKGGESGSAWIIVWKQYGQHGYMPDARNMVCVPQTQLAELMSCADAFISSSRLRSFFMVEWEAMACDLPMMHVDPSMVPQRDFIPSEHPRNDIIKMGWDRSTTVTAWKNYINAFNPAARL